jgi:predicted porin
MNSRYLVFAVISASAVAAHAQDTSVYRSAAPVPASEASLDYHGLRGTVSLDLANEDRSGNGRLFEYVDGSVEHSMRNFMQETRPRSPSPYFSDVNLDNRHRAWGLSLGFSAGPVAFRVAHQNKHVSMAAPDMALGNIMDAKNSVIAANIDVGPAKVYAAYGVNRGWGSSPLWNPDNPYSAALTAVPSTDSRDMMVGMALPRGRTTWLASFIRKNDRDLANRDADQLAFGMTHALSRHTDFYAGYSYTTIRSGAGLADGVGMAPGSGFSAVNIGMRHNF